MANEELEMTRKMDASGGKGAFGSEPETPQDHHKTQPIAVRKPKRWRMILIGIFSILLLGAAGGGLGYLNGIKDRVEKEKEEALTQAALQYQYGMQQLNSGNYELAKTHFEFVLTTYPEFPGITEKYTEVMVHLAETTGVVAMPQASPTPDTRQAEELFNAAVQQVQSQQWSEAMDTLEALRNADYTYRTVDVDGLYYTTLRHHGAQKLAAEGDLEEGLYLFAILGKYAPVDRDVVNYSSWARLYLTGASFWEVDWEQVVNYFGQLYAAFPNMHDGSGWTAADRYMTGSESYGDQLAEAGDPCGALAQYQNVLNISAIETVQNKYNEAFLKCYPPTPTPEKVIVTPIPEETLPIETETPIPQEENPEPNP